MKKRAGLVLCAFGLAGWLSSCVPDQTTPPTSTTTTEATSTTAGPTTTTASTTTTSTTTSSSTTTTSTTTSSSTTTTSTTVPSGTIAVGCYQTPSPSGIDFNYLGPIGQQGNLELRSGPANCMGSLVAVWTLVSATSSADALSKCPAGTTTVDTPGTHGYSMPINGWYCNK